MTPDANSSLFGLEIIDVMPNSCSAWLRLLLQSSLKRGMLIWCSECLLKKNFLFKTSGLSCTSFCKCLAQDSCNNPHTKYDDNDSKMTMRIVSRNDFYNILPLTIWYIHASTLHLLAIPKGVCLHMVHCAFVGGFKSVIWRKWRCVLGSNHKKFIVYFIL